MYSSPDNTSSSIEDSTSSTIVSIINKLTSSIEDSKSSTTVSSGSERSSPHSSGTYISQPMLTHVSNPRTGLESSFKDTNLSSTNVDKNYTSHESSIELCMAEFLYGIQQACAPLNPRNDEHSVFKIVTSDFHTTKNGIPEVITLQIARLKDGVTLNFKEIEPFAIAGIFVAFYDQWQWWNKNYMKFHFDAMRLGKMTLESLKRVQGAIHLLPPSTKKPIGVGVASLLDLEDTYPFMRAYVIELITNATQHVKSHTDFNKACDEYVRQMINREVSAINPGQFASQHTPAESSFMLVDQVKPPSATELNSGSANDMALYLRGCETRRQTVLWSLLHRDFVNELTWMWRSRQGELKSAPDVFKDATIEQQIDWLESLYKKNRDKPKKDMFSEFIQVNRLVFDLHKDHDLLEGPFGNFGKSV